MQVADLMHSPVTTVFRDSTVGEAVLTLADNHISAVTVVNRSGRMVGVLSTTDLLQAFSEVTDPLARAALFDQTQVDELMTPRPLTISPESHSSEAARQMFYANVHRLFVEQGGELVGVISQTDLVRALAIQRA